MRNEDFASRPISDPSDILEVTPGLFTVQHAGGGKANQYFLRGFDIDHGTDLALSVDGVGDEGTHEARPATTRRGLELEVRYRVTPWLRADADVTWARARFRQPTGGGVLFPLAPELTWAGGLQADLHFTPGYPRTVSGTVTLSY